MTLGKFYRADVVDVGVAGEGQMRGKCTCGHEGPVTKNLDAARLWGLGHVDGHTAKQSPDKKV